jgi:hypothetical protein
MTGVPVIARLAISTTLFGIALLTTGALPSELRALIPDFIARSRLVGR